MFLAPITRLQLEHLYTSEEPTSVITMINFKKYLYCKYYINGKCSSTCYWNL